MPSLIRRVINRVTGSRSPAQGESTGAQTLLLPNIVGGMGGGAIAGIPPGLLGGFTGLINPLSGNYGDWLGTDPYAYGQRWVKSWYWGTYNTYRLVAAHPRVQQAKATLINPILGGSWDFEKVDPACPDKLVDLVARQLKPLRRQYLTDACEAVDLGWAPFDPVWGMREGGHWLTRLKPLLQDITTIRTDTSGNIVELINGSAAATGDTGNDADRLLVDRYKALVYSFRPKCGYWYGYPLAENVRLGAWRMWLSAAFDLHNLSNKISSMIAMGFAPSGTYSDGKGGTVTPKDEMTTALQGLKDTGMAVFSNLVAMQKPGASAADLAKASQAAMSSIEFHDAGNHSPAIGGYISIMDKAEDLFFAAYLLSSRTGMQSEHGSRADSEQHSDTGLVSSQLIADDLAEQLQPMVDAILVLNGGENYRGAVRVKQSPLVDDTKSLYGQIFTTALANPTVAPAILAALDLDAMAKRVDLAVKDGAAISDAVGEAVDRQNAQQDAAAKAQVDAIKNPKPAVGGNNPAAGKKSKPNATELSRAPYKFASTQVDIPEPHRSQLLKFAASIPDDEIDPEEGRETDPHVTTLYGLHGEDASEVQSAIAGEKPPTLRLGKLGVFPATEKRNSDVLYVSVHSPDLHRLNRKLRGACEHTQTHDGYTPHLTLAYLKPGEGAKYDGGCDFDGHGVRPTHLTHGGKDGTKTRIPLYPKD